MRRLALSLIALGGGLALAIGPAGPAHAHATLVSSVPAGSSVLDTAPTDITLDFDEPVSANPGGIRLIDSSGTDMGLGASEHGSDSSVVVTPVPEVPDGAYVVAWQVVSQDGHPASGAFAFQIGRGSAIDTRALIASVLNEQGGDGAVEQLATFNRLLTYTGLALAIGGGVFVVAIWPGAAVRWSARRLIWFGWGLLLVGTVGTLALAGPYLTGGPLGDALDLDVFRSVADTRVVQMAGLRLLLVLLALPLLLRLGRGLSNNAQLAGVLLGELGLGTVALAGHAGSGRWSAVGVILDAVHLGAMAVWLGGLALLVVLLAATPTGPDGFEAGASPTTIADTDREPSSARSADGESTLVGSADGEQTYVGAADDESTFVGSADGEQTYVGRSVGAAMAPIDERAEAVDRFSTVAFACVVALVVTGVAQTWRLLPGGLADLTTTDYGRTLLVKLAFVAALVGLGWWSWRLIRRRLVGQPLWRSVATEVVVAIAVLAVTAVLTGSSPSEARSGSAGVSATIVQGDLLADVSVIPAEVGFNELHVTLSPAGGSLAAVKDATARMTLPSRTDLGPIPVELTPAGPNHYIGSGFQIPFAGDWTLELVITAADDATVLMSTTIAVSDAP